MTGIKDYSPIPASNTALFPEGMAPSAVNDGMRQVQADIRAEVASKGADIASAETVALGAATGDFVDVTGTTAIISFGTVSEGIRRTVRFRGALTLTHNATSLILPGGANITTADGDIARFRSLGSGNWVCEFYSPVGALPVNRGGTGATTAALARTALGLGALATLDSVAAGQIDADAVGASELANSAVAEANLNANLKSRVCQAWLNFDGTDVPDAKDHIGISSIVDLGVGQYRINLSITMVNSSYSVNLNSTNSFNGTSGAGRGGVANNLATTSFNVWTFNTSTAEDHPLVQLSVHGD